MNIIQIDKIKKVYHENEQNRTEVLHDVSLVVKEGDFIAVMGESGSGKSTLLNMITTIIPPTEGEICIDGKKLSQLNENEKASIRSEFFGYVFQDNNLLNCLTVYENIVLPLKMNQMPEDQIHENIKEVSGKLGIIELLDKYPNECSGGEQQRVSIARVIASKPKVIIADEPTGKLDSNNMKDVMHLFEQLNEDGMTIMMVTHDSAVASYSEKVIYIGEGTLLNTIHRDQRDKMNYHQEIVSLVSSRREFV